MQWATLFQKAMSDICQQQGLHATTCVLLWKRCLVMHGQEDVPLNNSILLLKLIP